MGTIKSSIYICFRKKVKFLNISSHVCAITAVYENNVSTKKSFQNHRLKISISIFVPISLEFCQDV